jgi:hypothetical protein
MSKNILNILKAECGKLIEYNICLERITKKILYPSNKSVSRRAYIILFSVFCAFRIFFNSHTYNEIYIVFLSSGIIVIEILLIPIRTMLKSRRNKRFDKYKDELNSILIKIKKSLNIISSNQIKIEFVNEPCLREISRYMEKDGNTVSKAVKRFEEEKYNSKEFVHKKKIAEIRCKNLLVLDKLSKTPHVTSSLQMWTDLYSPIWETIEDYGITRKK